MNEASTTNISEDVAATMMVEVGGFSEATFEFLYRWDGTGTCKDMDCGDTAIEFAWDPSILEGVEDNRREEVLETHANMIFWDEINDQLDEDKVLRDEDFHDGELTFESGSSEELERFLGLVLYAFPSIWGDAKDGIDVTIQASTESEAAEITDYCDLMNDSDISDEERKTICELIGFGLDWNRAVGFTLEYNDGATGRASGYYESPCTVDYTIPRPSFHELAEARQELAGILVSHGLEEEIERLLAEGDPCHGQCSVSQ